MHLRYRLAVLLSAVCLILGASFAQAAKIPGTTTSIVGKPMQYVNLGTNPIVDATCELGQLGVPTAALDWLLPPNDRYFTLLDPAACSVCGANGLQLTTAKILLDFVVGCNQPVEVSIVGTNGDPNCSVPDPTNILCGPVTYNLTVPASGLYQFGMPLPAGCCINQRAFLQINFPVLGQGCESAASRPYLVQNEVCEPCASYNEYGSGMIEWCSFGLPNGNPMMSVDAECCQPVPTDKKSWGEMKLRYR